MTFILMIWITEQLVILKQDHHILKETVRKLQSPYLKMLWKIPSKEPMQGQLRSMWSSLASFLHQPSTPWLHIWANSSPLQNQLTTSAEVELQGFLAWRLVQCPIGKRPSWLSLLLLVAKTRVMRFQTRTSLSCIVCFVPLPPPYLSHWIWMWKCQWTWGCIQPTQLSNSRVPSSAILSDRSTSFELSLQIILPQGNLVHKLQENRIYIQKNQGSGICKTILILSVNINDTINHYLINYDSSKSIDGDTFRKIET